MQKKILVVTYGGGHARMLRPVIEILIEDPSVDVHVMALNTAAKELEDLDITLFGYAKYFYDDPNVQKYGRELMASLDKVIDEKETISYLGVNFCELVDTYGLEEANRMYKDGGRYIFEPDNAMYKVLKNENPDILITTNSPRTEKSAVIAARRLGIKSVSLIDMFGIRCSSWFADNDFSDKILVLSDSVKQYLVSLGRDADSVVVTGNPSFDSLAQHYDDNKDTINNERKKMPFTVLWASQPEPVFLPETGDYGDTQLPLNIEKEVLKVFAKHQDWKLIARNHPSEVKRNYPEAVTYSNQGDDLVELFKNIHVVLTPSSTLGFQGAIMGAKLVTIDLSILTPTMPYADMGFSVGLKSIEDIEQALLELYKTKSDSGKPAYYETGAAQNVARVIYSEMEVE